MDEVGNFAIAATMDKTDLVYHLKNYEGLDLRYSKATEKYTLMRGKKKLEEFNKWEDVINQNPHLLPKVTSQLGPQLTYVDNSKVAVKYIQGTAVGPYDLMLRHLDSFQNYKPSTAKVKLMSGNHGSLSVNKITKELEVYLPDLEWKSPVTSITGARRVSLSSS